MKMNTKVQQHQPLISRQILFASQALPPPPIISRRMECGIRLLRHRLQHGATDSSMSRGIVPPRSPVSTFTMAPASATLPPSSSRFSAHPRPLLQREPTPFSLRKNGAPSSTPGEFSVRFQQDEDNESWVESEDGDNNEERKIPKPRGEPGRPGSGGYRLEDKLGWNKATFEAITVRKSPMFMN